MSNRGIGFMRTWGAVNRAMIVFVFSSSILTLTVSRSEADPDVPASSDKGKAGATQAPKKAQADRKAKAEKPPGAAEPKAAAAAHNPPAPEIEEVHVTARRREEKAQDVPVSLHVVSGQSLDRDSADQLRSLQNRAPDLIINQSNPRQTTIGIRGVGFNMANDGFDPSVGVFVDGVYLGRPGEYGFDLPDIDQIEVLRGPQGTLFGRNTSAGALNITTRPPSFTPEFSAESIFGNYDLREYKFSASTPVSDTLAVRLSGYDDQRGGLQSNAFDGSSGNTRGEKGLRAQALYEPNDDFSLRLIYSHMEQKEVPPLSVFTDDAPVKAGALNFSQRAALYPGFVPAPSNIYKYNYNTDSQFLSKGQEDFASAEANWRLPNGFKLTSITGYVNYNFYPTNDFDYTNLPSELAGGTYNHARQYSQEFRVSTPSGGPVDAVAGLYYFHQKVTANTYADWGPDGGLESSQATAKNIHSIDTILNGWNSLTTADPTTDSFAAFGQSTWHISPQWDVTGGLRETFDEKNEHLNQTSSGGRTTSQLLALGDPNITSSLINSVRSNGTFVDTKASVQKWNLSGMASVDYKMADNIMTYLSYGRGYKSPAINVAVAPAGTSQIVGEETTDDVELGVKTTLLNHRLLLNLDAFYEIINGYQANVTLQTTGKSVNLLTNAGSVVSRGLETDITLLPFRGLRIDASGSFDEAYYGSYPNAPCPVEASAFGTASCNLSGSRVANAPRFLANLNAEYDYPVSDDLVAYLVAQDFWRSGAYLSNDNTGFSYQPGYNIINLRVGARWKGGKYDVSFFGNNITNTHYLTSFSDSTNTVLIATPGDPLFVGVRLAAKF